MKYIDIITNAYTGYASYLWQEITNPSWHNYFYWLLLVSLFFLVLEVVIPWRKKQPTLRKDFWLDGFYMFFNFFIFSLIIYQAASDVVVHLFNDGIKALTGGFDLQAINPMRNFPVWEEMGFAAHLRFHWMENIVYRVLEYIPLAFLGIGLHDFFIIHIFTLIWGHYNHSNISISGYVTGGLLGAFFGVLTANGLLDIPLFFEMVGWQKIGWILIFAGLGSLLLGNIMKYIFNSPEMHIWHHSYELPKDRHTGVNFAIYGSRIQYHGG